jgi:hypothetical protein
MLDIISLFYRQSCKASLSAIRNAEAPLGLMFTISDPTPSEGRISQVELDRSLDDLETSIAPDRP